MDSSQYMGIFGSHDDSYLLPNFLGGGIPMPSMGDHHHPKSSSNESSPSYESLNGSLPSSGGSPYDSHSPAEAPEHLDGARHSSISPTSGSFGDFQMTAFHQGGPNRQQHPSAGAPQALYAGWKASQAVMPPQAPELPKVLYGPPSVQPPYGMQNLGSHLPIAPEISQQPVLYSSGAYQRQNAAQQTYPPWMFPQANMANMSSQPAQTTAQPPPPPPPEQQLKRRRVASAAGPSEPTASTPVVPSLPSDSFTPFSKYAFGTADKSSANASSAATSAPIATDSNESSSRAPSATQKRPSIASLNGNAKSRHSELNEGGEEDMEENGPSGHNAVEKRYRTKINSSLTTLQNLIPALSHLKEAENAPQVSRRSSAFILSAPQVTAFPAGTRIDGVEAPTKLSKGIIIDKGIEYIAVLKEERQELQQRLAVAEQLISEVPNGRAVYESRLSQARSHPQSPNQTQTQSSPGGARSRTAMAVFGGIGLFGAGSTMSSFGSAVDPETSTSAWSGASHLAKRAANGLVESTPQGSNSWSTYIGWLAVLAWVIVLAHYLGSKLASCSVSEPVIVRPTRRDEALKALEQDALGYTPSSGPSQWHAQASVAKAQRARSALLTLSKASGYGSVASGTLGLMWQGFRSYLQKWMVPQSLDVADPDTAEHLTALVRLADVESAFGSRVASRIGRLHTFLRLHNAFHYIKRPEKDVTSLPSELSQARIEATLSLLLVSIFGAQSTPLSRRRRFWSQATTLREGQSDIKLDPWLEVALATDYDEACHAAFESDKFFPFASSSDFSPLRRIAEHRCIMALALVWNQLFISVIFNAARADFGDKLKWFPATKSTKDDQFAEKIRRVISSVAQDSPDLPLARLTLGFWALGVGDKQLAQQQASCLLGDLRQGGPSGYYASIPFFVTMVLPFSRELNFYAVNKPTTSLDMLALTSLQWLTLRRQYLRLVDNTVDARFYDATLSFRTVLNSSTWAAKELNQPDFQVDFVTAQSTCIQLVESMGRKAAGIGSALSSVSSSRSFDSGFEEEEEFF